MNLTLAGLNHKTAPIGVRERLALTPRDIEEALPIVCERAGADEGMLVSTCNRVEMLAVRHSSDSGAPRAVDMFEALCEFRGLDEPLAPDLLYEHRDDDAVRHVFRLAAGLDSMVLGEPQILGQLKDAFATASDAGATGRYLNRILTTAFRVGKRVRSETDLGSGGWSVASVAVSLAAKVLGDLGAHTGLVIGAGEMAETAARHLCEKGIGKLLFANRTAAKAEKLANDFGGEALPFEQLFEGLERADVVISSTAAPGVILSHEQFHQVMDKRYTRPIFLVDIAVPRDIDPEINDHDNAFVYDIDSLQDVTDQNLARRQKAMPAAETIVDEELANYGRWLESLRVEPLIKRLNEEFDAMRRREVRKNLKRFHEQEADDLDKLTRIVQKRILHGPARFLRQCDPDTEEGRRIIEVVRKLFDVD